MGMNIWYLPLDKDRPDPQAPIFVSNNIHEASRVIVLIGNLVEDLGVFSYRDICDDGIEFGSVLKLAAWALSGAEQNTALILANPGGRVWQNSLNAAVNLESFNARPRESVAARSRAISLRNAVQVKDSLLTHTQHIFERLLYAKMKMGCKVDVIGLSEGGYAAVMYLKQNWSFWRPHMSSIAIANPEQVVTVDFDVSDLGNPESFLSFLKNRGRGWVLSSKELGVREVGLGTHGVNCFSSGEDYRITRLVSRSISHIISWQNIMYLIPTMMEQVVLIDGEPYPDGQVIRGMLGLDVYENYSGDEPLDTELSEVLEGFVNGLFTEMDLTDAEEMEESLNSGTKMVGAESFKVVGVVDDGESRVSGDLRETFYGSNHVRYEEGAGASASEDVAHGKRKSDEDSDGSDGSSDSDATVTEETERTSRMKSVVHEAAKPNRALHYGLTPLPNIREDSGEE
ncbi:unnamed protein product [Penicillium salamii]|uniref:Arb2 domain-containing protein n=1 Tax=Penicillium salamii TaxID=1612424 RepID=A0A9W4NH35_9EURO|nr:unnamed protein product [Penicillium salamii]